MPTADGSAEVPEGSISDRETIMQKREIGSAEGRAPANLHLTAVTSFLVATLSQHGHQFFPVGIIKTSPAREHSHVAYLAENQCASHYIGTLLVKMMIKHEHMNLGSRHGLLESSQSKFGPGYDPPTPLMDFARIWEMRRVMTLSYGAVTKIVLSHSLSVVRGYRLPVGMVGQPFREGLCLRPEGFKPRDDRLGVR